MEYSQFKKKYIHPYNKMSYIFFPELGYIVWRLGSGENVELLHVRAFKPGNGFGLQLIKYMIHALSDKTPYYSIFGFSLSSNLIAISMYKKAGFQIFECPFPYKTTSSVSFYQSYEYLKEHLKIHSIDETEYREFYYDI